MPSWYEDQVNKNNCNKKIGITEDEYDAFIVGRKMEMTEKAQYIVKEWFGVQLPNTKMYLTHCKARMSPATATRKYNKSICEMKGNQAWWQILCILAH